MPKAAIFAREENEGGQEVQGCSTGEVMGKAIFLEAAVIFASLIGFAAFVIYLWWIFGTFYPVERAGEPALAVG